MVCLYLLYNLGYLGDGDADGVKLFTVVEQCPRTSFSRFGGDIFRGHQIPSQERGSDGPFLASQTPIFAT